MKGFLFWATALVLPAWAHSASAQSAVESQMQAYRVVTATDGGELFKSAESANPGDVIEYRIEYRTAGEAVSGLRVNGPVPAGTEYIDGSASASVTTELRFSDDGERWQSAPVKRITDHGEQIVPPADYTNVLWIAQEPLTRGQVHTYRYRVRVPDASAQTPEAEKPAS